MKVGIIGATGYGGVELIRILQQHPAIKQLSLYSSSQAETKIYDHFPHLQRVKAAALEDIDPPTLGDQLDVVFLATPSGISSTLSPKLLDQGLPVIDLSGDFRIRDKQLYESWYKKEAPADEWLEKAVYGLPEFAKEEVKHARLVANPGCFPTAVLLGLMPLLSRHLIEADSLIVDAKTGLSGAGKSPTEVSHFSHTSENFRIYKMNSHQHVPEIEEQLQNVMPEMAPITFSSHLVPMTRGIMATMYAKIKQPISDAELYTMYSEVYKDEPFVWMRKPGEYPATKEVYASNQCDIGLAYDKRTQRVTVVSVIDNLMKGAAGQAVQNFNVMIGADETAGLKALPVFP